MKSTGVITLLLLLLSTTLLQAQSPDWKLEKDKKGIKVYTCLEEGEKFKSTKAETTIEGSLKDIMTVLFDYSRYKEWSPNCIEARTVSNNLDNNGLGTIVSYTLNNAPWPVSNRDIVVHNTVTRIADGSTYVKMKAIDSSEPKPRDVVRMTYFKGYWKFTPLSNGKVKTEYYAVFDPEGSVPAWVINMAVEDTPYELLKNLQEQVAKY